MFKPIRTKRVFEEISDQIKEMIYSGTLKPGNKLPSERELATEFRAGRMVVREALRILEQAGFIYIRQGSEGGAFVKNADISVLTRSFSDLIRLGNVTIQSLTEARLGIERVIVEFAVAKVDEKDLDLLHANIDEAEKLLAQGIRPREANIDFHFLLARATKNPVFEMIARSVMEIVSHFLSELTPDMAYIKKVTEYHKEIFCALKERDLIRARSKMEEHLLEVNRELLQLFQTTKD